MKQALPRVLYVEDDLSSAQVLTLYFEQAHMHVSHFDNMQGAERALANLEFDVAVFDIMIKGGDGRTLLTQAVEKKLPALMVTAKVNEDDRLTGFDLGADDYICKPYSPKEVVARVKALLARSTRGHQLKEMRFGSLVINLSAQCVTIDNTPVALTSVEYMLLVATASYPNKVFSRDALIAAVWGRRATVSDRAVDTHMANLRKKIGGRNQAYIATRYGQGYQFVGTPS